MYPSVFLVTALGLLKLVQCLPLDEANLKTGYELCPPIEPDKLNVHIVCHSHDDVGWLKTVDEYFYGANNSIQNAGVQYILDSVVQSLLHDPNKRFVYVETAFFWRWYKTLDDVLKHQVQNLVCKGQLEFAGGGWSMNDEATTHYASIIDQMTWGLRKLNDSFGSCGVPKVAWQIDPFGHSREQASIFAQMYFDGLFFGRLDYQDKDQRMLTKNMEHIWKGSSNLGSASNLFTGALHNNYSPPPGFCFDVLCGDPPIMDDPTLKNYNVEERVADFIDYVKDQATHFATNNIVLTMGNDFNYQNAATWYKNLDKLIKYVNQKKSNGSNVNVFYSTPGCYLYSLNNANHTWTTKTDDFLPYASDPHAYWTGFFSSRPSVKRYERIGNNNLQMCKQLASMTELEEIDVIPMREAMGIMQHHDAVTGTEKQHVADDYVQTLASAIENCQETATSAYEKLMNQTATVERYFCNYLNISECNVTEASKPVAVTIYNPLAWPINTYIRLPVVDKAFKVLGPDGKAVDSQVVDIPTAVLKIPGRRSNATHELVFRVSIPALGYARYLVRPSENRAVVEVQRSKKTVKTTADWSIGNEFFKVFVGDKSGLLNRIQLADGSNITVNQSFHYYAAMKGNNSKFQFRASGAYIFRPNGTNPLPLGQNVTVTLVNGSLVQEIHQVFNPWLSQVIRVYKGVENIEFDWVIGPIPIDDGIGKEIVTRFDTDLQTAQAFYTDSNGREMLQRVRNFRPTWTLNVTEPVSGNYYPVNSRIFIRDKTRNLQLTLLNDRSQGGSSIKDGSMELMLHRRLLYDDAFGVGEPLNEPGVDGKGLVIRGSNFLVISDIPSSASKHRPLAQQILLQPHLSFTYSNGSAAFLNSSTQFSGLKSPLPPNVHLLTLEPWKAGRLLLRLEHIYEFYEDSQLSKPVTVALDNLFSTFTINSTKELTLGANQLKDQAKRLLWTSENTNNPFVSYVESAGKRRKNLSLNRDLSISLGPMMIRTFIIDVQF